MARKWPDKNPETKTFPDLATPMSTNAPKSDPQPGVNESVYVGDTPSNSIGYNGVTEGKKGRKR